MRTLLQLFKALEGNLKLVGLVESRGIVLDLDAEERHDRHCEVLLGFGVVQQGGGEMKAGVECWGSRGRSIEKQCKKRCRRKVVFTTGSGEGRAGVR